MEQEVHNRMSTMDRLWVIAELEHIRRHCITSAFSVDNDEDKFFYIVSAAQALQYRREWQAKYFPNITRYDWCLTKASMSLKQLLYETMAEDNELSKNLEQFTTGLISHAIKEDLSGCESCESDRAII